MATMWRGFIWKGLWMPLFIFVVDIFLLAHWLVQECHNPPCRTCFCILHWGHSFYCCAICLKALKTVQAHHRPYCQCPPIPFLVHRQKQTTQVPGIARLEWSPSAILMYHCHRKIFHQFQPGGIEHNLDGVHAKILNTGAGKCTEIPSVDGTWATPTPSLLPSLSAFLADLYIYIWCSWIAALTAHRLVPRRQSPSCNTNAPLGPNDLLWEWY